MVRAMSPEPARSIDDVIERLDAILADAKEAGSPAGYFPALYRRVTIAVRDAIARGEFEDNERMERLDVRFAQRYLDAVVQKRTGGQPTHSWAAAFAADDEGGLTVLQHLLLGMNAHINLDLGIAAAETCEPEALMSLKKDFNHINGILGSLLEDTQRRLTRIFGPLGLIDRFLGPIDERLSIFSIGYARDKAWTQALELALTPSAERAAYLVARDEAVARFARSIVRPPHWTARLLLRLVCWLERGDVRSRLREIA